MQNQKDNGTLKQKEAIAEILKETRRIGNDEEMVLKISHLPNITENFLISLIKNKLWQVILFVYESPYLLLKLAEAGLETDPRAKDSSEKSAFFHALKTEVSPEILFLLYHHAANVYSQTEASVRSPDPVMVDNLVQLKNHLRQLERDLESEEISEKSRCLFRDLCQFNDFQVEMCSNVNDIRLRTNHLDMTEKDHEAAQRKETILTILNTYETYFNPINEESEPAEDVDDLSHFTEYYKHRDYFDNIDLISALIFFDNLFLLKERLRLPNTAYLDVESFFCFFIHCRKYLKRYENIECFSFVSQWIIFQERLTFQRHLRKFKEILKKTEVSKDNIVNKLQDENVETLTNLPLIFNESFVFRLQFYLHSATKLSIKDAKSILAIERCLQVLGECCKNTNFNSVQTILTSVLPKDSITHLKQIRNRLGHIKTYQRTCKYNLEHDEELFKEIQNELNKLAEFFSPLQSAHTWEMDKFLLLLCEKYISKARKRSIFKQHENELTTILPSPAIEENQLLMPTSYSQTRWNISFDDAHTYLRKEIENLDCNGRILDKNTSSICKCIVQNMISAVERKWKSLEAPVKKEDLEKLEELDSQFWCLEIFLKYITSDRVLTMHNTTLTSMSKERESLFTKMREKLQTTNNSIDSSTVGTAVTHYGIAAKPLFDCDKNQAMANPTTTYAKYGLTFKISSLQISNETVEYTKKILGGSETNQEKIDNNRQSIENRVSENRSDGHIPQDTKEDAKGYARNGEKFIQTEKNHPSCAEGRSASLQIPDVAEDQAEIVDVDERNFIKKAEKFVVEYKKLVAEFFQEFQEDSNENFNLKNISNYCWLMKGHRILNKEETECILQSVPKEFQKVPETKKRLEYLLTEKSDCIEEIKKELSKLSLKDKKIKKIIKIIECGPTSEAVIIVYSIDDYFLNLKKAMEKREICKREYELICKKLNLSNDAKDILSKLVLKENKTVHYDRFEFLLNRIKMLKNILIGENNAIQQLWQSVNTPFERRFVKEKIVQMYLNDSTIQASAEFLLYNCMAISDIKRRKIKNLFNGVNLKNVLAHGHPLLESLGRLLDPYDLPSELVEKMLKLISDEPVIESMQQISKHSGPKNRDFMELLENKDFQHLSETIVKCDHYYEYV